jgi:hypothetical protein
MQLVLQKLTAAQLPKKLSAFYGDRRLFTVLATDRNKPLTEMNTRNLSGNKGQPASKPDNLTAICEPIA